MAGIQPRTSDIAFYSTVADALLDTATLDAEYWYRNLRQTVQLEQATLSLAAAEHQLFIEVSPHPVLTAAMQETIDISGTDRPVTVVGTLRRDLGDLQQFFMALAEVSARGTQVDWPAMFTGLNPQAVELPTYAFQRQRYWLEPAITAARAGDLGLSATTHPLLGASIGLADGNGLLFTGRLSLRTHPWLAEHNVLGTILLPGAAFVELALQAGEHTGCDHIEELILEAPLVLPEQGGVHLQISVASPDDGGRRQISIYSQADDIDISAGTWADQQWIRHASGILAPSALYEGIPPFGPTETWPAENAQPIDIDDLYENLRENGVSYGPIFRGLRAAWRLDDKIFAEVSLAEEHARDTGRFGIHPALLDASIQPSALYILSGQANRNDIWLPFSWTGVSLHATDSLTLRVCLSPADHDAGDHAVNVTAYDSAGAPVVSIKSLASRPMPRETRKGIRAAAHGPIVRMTWSPVTIPDGPSSAQARWAVLGRDPLDLASALRYTFSPCTRRDR